MSNWILTGLEKGRLALGGMAGTHVFGDSASGGTGSLSAFFSKLGSIVSEYQAAGTVVIIVIALLILGTKLMIGDDEDRMRSRKSVPFIIIGAAILVSAWNVAGYLSGVMSF